MISTVATRKLWKLVIGAAAVGGCAVAVILPSSPGTATREHEITITARQYGYDPHRIVVASGDRVSLRLASKDVVHGFYLEGHDLEAEVRPGRLAFRIRRPSSGDVPFEETEEVSFVAGRPGKYRYRCSITCGPLHPFMQGELVIRPNSSYRTGAVATVGLTLGLMGLSLLRTPRPSDSGGPPRPSPKRLDLLRRFPSLERLLTWRGFPLALIVPNVLVFFFFIIAGLYGSPIGNRNIIVTVIWILWWFLLITLLVPLGGRSWCMICPLPFFGEWFARRRLWGVRSDAERSSSLRTGSLNRKWPRRLSNLWLQSLLFLLLCTFSAILVTRPALTAVVLAVLVLGALVVHALYQRRTFCRYLCPLNAWMSVYAMTGMVEVRARDRTICSSCRHHACATGTADAWRCPWLVRNPARLSRNNHCGLCMECVKACPNRNLTVRARPFCSDLRVRGYDEAWMAMIMIVLVVSYTVTLLGPWGMVKTWANVTESKDWVGFLLQSVVIWFVALVGLPAVWYLLSGIGRWLSRFGEIPTREIFLRYSYVLVPLGLVAWAAFSFPLVMVNYTHITSSLSDPLGWGWNLFGTADQRWSPLLPEAIPYLQVPLLLLGLYLALRRGLVIAHDLFPTQRAAALSLLPHGLFCGGLTLLLLRLFVG